ncbi:hypothetical protein QBC32DRAFT_366149 [Pseudoneurospora amorphoporcata]|uniref:Uncharacterized protein n=1 Tax=Pseudoneurospora amorphoporcata TaxID=241081 RepID=A0AAN6SAB9_9PEZI|nr:hypothetical protein QBC32DRAFT_366149 [Pseudoneurospora amorphoporcata]
MAYEYVVRANLSYVEALADSARLNKARVAHPLRNNYGLKPGTVVGGGHGPGEQRIASIKQDVEVPPLLDITDEIAAAAALVAEADSVGGWKNVTKRAATASTGTYWMQGLSLEMCSIMELWEMVLQMTQKPLTGL